MPLINCEINLILTWSKECVTPFNTAANQATTFAISDTKMYVPVVALSTQDNAKLLQQLKSGFKRTVNWNKYQSKVSIQVPNPCLDYLLDPSFQGFFVLSFESTTNRTAHTKCYLPAVQIKDYNGMIDAQTFFDQPVKNDSRTYDNIRKNAIGQGDDYTTDCLLDYNYFKYYYKMIAVGFNEQQTLDADQNQYNKLILQEYCIEVKI